MQSTNFVIPLWLKTRLREVVVNYDDPSERIHYENSIYGPLNTILHLVFGVSDHYMIKPQPILRASVANRHFRSESSDSYADFVRSRRTRGKETSLLKPDFIIVKVDVDVQANNSDLLVKGARAAGPSRDTIVLIVEAKRDNLNVKYDAPWMQLIKYLKRCKTKQRLMPLYGMLTLGNETYIVKYDSRKVGVEPGDVNFYVTEEDELWMKLHDMVAVEHGNKLQLVDQGH